MNHDRRSSSRAMDMTGAEQHPAEPTTTVTGQLVKARKLSSRLAFADLVLAAPTAIDDASPDAATAADAYAGETIELVLKQCPSLPSIRLALKAWKLGDVVSVPGHFEDPTNDTARSGRTHRTFRVAGPPVVVHAYDNKGGKEPFKPVFALCQPCKEGTGDDQVVDPGTGSTDELCKYYTSERRCPRAPRCNYVHTDDPAVRAEWFASKRRRAVEAEAAVVGGPQPQTSAVVSKARRAEAFASFLTNTFDLSKDSLVLDVAGGRGDLCFELSAVRNVPCVSVDPRGRKLNKRQRKFLKERRVVEGARANNEGDDGEGGEPWSGHIRSLFHADFFEDDQHVGNELRGRVSVVAGLHPDEATEHIVDCALKHRIPFAIVPCCVFHLDGGSMSFEAWCHYLQGKDGRIKRGYINCGGKNLVLYCTFAS